MYNEVIMDTERTNYITTKRYNYNCVYYLYCIIRGVRTKSGVKIDVIRF